MLVDIGLGEAERAGALMVDVEMELRRVVLPVGTHGGQERILGGHAQQLVARRQQLVVTETGTVLKLKIEPGGVAQLLHGRRHEHEDLGVADLGEGPPWRAGRWPGRGSLRPADPSSP